MAAGMSTARLADAIGAAQSTVVRYETGAIRPTPERLVALAAALGTTPDTLTRNTR